MKGVYMKTFNVMLGDLTRQTFQFGYEGESNYTGMRINCIEVFSEYPDAEVSLAVQSPTGVIYPATIELSGVMVIWNLTSSDLAAAGGGSAQLTFTENNVIVKSVIFGFGINPSLITNGDPPDPLEDWITEATETLQELQGMISVGVPIEDVTVTGATPSITAEANKRYLCGTLTSLTITLPESGMFEVVFTSGSTATTLTASGVTFPSWFSVEANYTYEISILDGMAVVAVWPTT